MNFAAYVDMLRTRFAGKDVNRLPKHLRGTITFLFRTDGTVSERLTMRVVGNRVDIVTQTQLQPDERTAIIRSSLDDWIAFFENNDVDRMETIDFMGDAELLSALPALAAQKLSPLQTRLQR